MKHISNFIKYFFVPVAVVSLSACLFNSNSLDIPNRNPDDNDPGKFESNLPSGGYLIKLGEYKQAIFVVNSNGSILDLSQLRGSDKIIDGSFIEYSINTSNKYGNLDCYIGYDMTGELTSMNNCRHRNGFFSGVINLEGDSVNVEFGTENQHQVIADGDYNAKYNLKGNDVYADVHVDKDVSSLHFSDDTYNDYMVEGQFVGDNINKYGTCYLGSFSNLDDGFLKLDNCSYQDGVFRATVVAGNNSINGVNISFNTNNPPTPPTPPTPSKYGK